MATRLFPNYFRDSFVIGSARLVVSDFAGDASRSGLLLLSELCGVAVFRHLDRVHRVRTELVVVGVRRVVVSVIGHAVRVLFKHVKNKQSYDVQTHAASSSTMAAAAVRP